MTSLFYELKSNYIVIETNKFDYFKNINLFIKPMQNSSLCNISVLIETNEQILIFLYLRVSSMLILDFKPKFSTT